jgi:hypothetical protein
VSKQLEDFVPRKREDSSNSKGWRNLSKARYAGGTHHERTTVAFHEGSEFGYKSHAVGLVENFVEAVYEQGDLAGDNPPLELLGPDVRRFDRFGERRN